MTRSLDEANRAISAVRRMPYGATRSASALSETERVEADGPTEALAYAYGTLVDSYVWGEEVDKAFVPFTRSLRLFDERPDLFDEDDVHALFWSFKWMTGHLVDFPEISAAQIDATLADMERRFAVAGHGLNAVRLSTFRWESHRNPDPAAVTAAYEAWVLTPRDDFSQCDACEPGDRAAFLVGAGRTEEAVRIIESVLPDDPRCATEPADMLSHLQLAHLELGDAEGVARAHRRSLGHLTHDYDLSGPISRNAEVLARTGNVERALRMLARVADVVAGSRDPGMRLTVLTHVGVAARALSLDDPTTPVALPGVPATNVTELATWVDAAADEIAAAFDLRNGNDVVSRRLTDARARAAHTLDVDLAVLSFEAGTAADVVVPADATGVPAGGPGSAGGSAAGDGSAVADGGPVGDRVPVGDGEEVERLLAAAAEVEDGEPLVAARHYLAASRLAESVGLLPTAGFALAEAAQLAALQDDHASAATAFRRSLALLRAGAVDPRDAGPVARAAAEVTTRADDIDALLTTFEHLLGALTDRAGQDPVTLPGHDARLTAREAQLDAAEVRELRDRRARLLATTGRLTDAAAEALALADEFRAAGADADAGHALWLAARCLVGSEDLEGGLAHLVDAARAFVRSRRRDSEVAVSDEIIEVLERLGRGTEAETVLGSIAAGRS